MKLTEKRAIELSIELWEWLAETGKEKSFWSGWVKYGVQRGKCFLCEYDRQQQDNCCNCPYFKKFGLCAGDELKTFYDKWDCALTKSTRKKYALKLLTQLRELLNKEAI